MEKPASSEGLTLTTFAIGTIGSILLVGGLGAVVGWARGRSVDTSVALAYYFVGAIVFIAGSFPAGGFSTLRGTRSRRRPTGGGAFAVPSMLLGAVLVGIGILVDVTHPF